MVGDRDLLTASSWEGYERDGWHDFMGGYMYIHLLRPSLYRLWVVRRKIAWKDLTGQTAIVMELDICQ